MVTQNVQNLRAFRRVAAIADGATLGPEHWGQMLTIASGSLTVPAASLARDIAEVILLKTSTNDLTLNFDGSDTIRGSFTTGPAVISGAADSVSLLKRLSGTDWLLLTSGDVPQGNSVLPVLIMPFI